LKVCAVCVFRRLAGRISGEDPMKVTLIHNPGAGDKERPDRDWLIAMVQSAGHDVTYQSLKKDDWHITLEDPVDLVVAAGGDGTVGEVARKLIGRRIPVAVLPTGTANNVSRTLGVGARPWNY
jgi:diacylglycerol kinase (ATP)